MEVQINKKNMLSIFKRFKSLFGATVDEPTQTQQEEPQEVQVSGWVVVFIIIIILIVLSQARVTTSRGQYYNDGSYYNNGPYNNGPYNNGPYNNGPYNNGPYNNGPYNNGPRYNNVPRRPSPPPSRSNGGGGVGIKFTAPKVGLNLKNLGKGSVLSLK
jgi:hypothetical protein